MDVNPQVVSTFIIQNVRQVDQDTLAKVYALTLEVSTQLIDHHFDTHGMSYHPLSRVAPYLGSYNMIPMVGLLAYPTSHYTYVL